MGDCRGGNVYVTCRFRYIGLIKPSPEIHVLCLEHDDTQLATHVDMDEVTGLSPCLQAGSRTGFGIHADAGSNQKQSPTRCVWTALSHLSYLRSDSVL
jgi:hypothetical protein